MICFSEDAPPCGDEMICEGTDGLTKLHNARGAIAGRVSDIEKQKSPLPRVRKRGFLDLELKGLEASASTMRMSRSPS